MNRTKIGAWAGAALALTGLVVWLYLGRGASAHCDSLDGPVITEAKAALQKGEVTPLLKWVGPEQEAEIREAFRKTLAVRSKGAQAKELADSYFFETLVRLHRAGEGAPYTGLKPAGHTDATVAAADRAIAAGQVDELAAELGRAAEQGVRARFARVLAAKPHQNESVEAGREYVEAYVTFVHYVEGLHQTIAGGSTHHDDE